MSTRTRAGRAFIQWETPLASGYSLQVPYTFEQMLTTVDGKYEEIIVFKDGNFVG